VALIPNQVPPVLSVVAHLGRAVQRVATDAVFGRLRSLPRTIGIWTPHSCRSSWEAGAARPSPGRELAYALVTCMTTADRQASERDLLDDYRRALVAAGGPELDSDDLWDRYQQGALYPYVAALITAAMGGMQDEGIALEGLRRAVAALDDHDTVALLRKSL
jgi:hypothetical protein